MAAASPPAARPSAAPESLPRPRLIELVNEIFHELEAGEYDAHHPEIWRHERRRWQRLLRLARLPERPLAFDVGGGTGFAATQVLRAHPRAEITLLDSSQAMLRVARARLKSRFPEATLQFRAAHEAAAEPKRLHDLVTFNSVLHHLPDPAGALRRAAARLKPGGAVVIAHEPNAPFYEDDGPRWVRRTASMHAAQGRWLDRDRWRARLERIAARAPLPPATESRHARTLEELRRRTGLEPAQLPTEQEIAALIDVHVPRRDGSAAGEAGLEIVSLLDSAGAPFALEWVEDYNRLADETHKSPAAEKLARVLEERGLPGAHWAAVLRRR